MPNPPAAVTAEEAIHSLKTEAEYWERSGKTAIAEECLRIATLIEQQQRQIERYEEAGNALAKCAEPFLSSAIVDETDGTVPLMNELDRAICEWRALKGE